MQAIGRYVYGLDAVGFGICAFIWPAFRQREQIGALAGLPHHEIFPYIIGAVSVIGGVAILSAAGMRAGSLAIGALFSVFAVLAIPAIVAQPRVYNGYNAFFEQLAFVSGAMILYARATSGTRSGLARAGVYAFALCLISFALEQWFYLSATASLVPKSIPPSQTFWAVATTVAFALAGIAMLIGRMALLAVRLTAAMLVGFALLVWLPALIATPHSFVTWSEALETVGITATACIVAGSLGRSRRGGRRRAF